MTRKAQILSFLERGPATSKDVADELGITIFQASAYLCNLRKFGVVRVLKSLPTGYRGRTAFLYSI